MGDLKKGGCRVPIASIKCRGDARRKSRGGNRAVIRSTSGPISNERRPLSVVRHNNTNQTFSGIILKDRLDSKHLRPGLRELELCLSVYTRPNNPKSGRRPNTQEKNKNKKVRLRTDRRNPIHLRPDGDREARRPLGQQNRLDHLQRPWGGDPGRSYALRCSSFGIDDGGGIGWREG